MTYIFYLQEALKSLKFYRGESKTTEEVLIELSIMKSLGSYKKKSTGNII